MGDKVLAQNGGKARFVKFDKKRGWLDLGNEQSREKVGHAMREALSAMDSKKDNKIFESKQSNLLEQQKAFFQLLLTVNNSDGENETDEESSDEDAVSVHE